MPTFAYTAKNNKGESRQGEIEGKHKRLIAEALRAEGFFVTSIEEKKEEEDQEIKNKYWVK